MLPHVQGPLIRRRGKKKAPPAPPRPLSAYFYFCNEIRNEVRIANTDKSVGELASLHAERWRALPDDKRAKYQSMHEEDKLKYMNWLDRCNVEANASSKGEGEPEVDPWAMP